MKKRLIAVAAAALFAAIAMVGIGPSNNSLAGGGTDWESRGGTDWESRGGTDWESRRGTDWE
ncbi:MAG: hypothetical protein M3445_10085 [Actinomycetota bacterium]|nr:hypothetical protein [Actinomycetota bacterium]